MKDSEQKNFQHKGQNRIMNETQFIEATEALMDDIEDALERSGLDADVDRSGNVMNIEFDNGEQVVVNRHGPTVGEEACIFPCSRDSGSARALQRISGRRFRKQ